MCDTFDISETYQVFILSLVNALPMNLLPTMEIKDISSAFVSVLLIACN